VNDTFQFDIDKVCRELSSAFQGTLTWKWDSRFETVLAEFGVDKKDNIRATLEQHLSAAWDSANVGNAPDTVRVIKDDLGGLMAGQILFTSDPNRGVVLFCAWWPWGNGEKISIRVGLWSKNLSDAEYGENLQQLKVCFGL
jgi:hypothetical protein